MAGMQRTQLRPYQQQAIADLRDAYRAGAKRPLLVLPTGGGKTVIFSDVAQSAVQRGGRVIVLVHRQELLTQSSRALSRLGVPHGCIAPGYPWQPRAPVQVASVQTLVRRIERIEAAGWRPSLIVVDEAHHAVAGSWATVLRFWGQARVLGVTATPIRMDGRGLAGAFDALVEGPQIAELIEHGYLSPPMVYAPPMQMDLSGVKTRGGDYDRAELGARVDKATVTGDAVSHYARICPGVPSIAFCVSVAHAEHVAEQFRGAGWQAASIDGSMDDTTRRRMIEDLGAGRLDVLTSCDIISEGTDIPIVGAAILLRPTKSTGLYLQQVGRALRSYEGKRCAYILDHAHNTKIHGLPDDDRQWSLDGAPTRSSKRETEGPPPPFTCQSCLAQIRVPLPPTCPACGAELVRGPDRMESLKTVDGELTLVTDADRAQIRRQRQIEQASATDLGSLVALAVRRGMKNPQGWAMHVMAARAAKAQRQTATPDDEGPPLW